jgi:inositol phosphorylceramide mannosyltransferase catalytic subunit
MSHKIPKIIHQIWFNFQTDDSGLDIGDHNRSLQKRLSDKNPNYKIFLWREQEAENLLKKYFPAYLSTYLFLDPIIRKVDYIRFFILYKYGGIYLDMDYFCLKSFDDYFNDYPQYKDSDIVLSKSCYGPWITNSIMMSRPGCNFWQFCFDQSKYGTLIPWWGNLQNHIETSCMTGPYFMTIVHESYKKIACNIEKITIEDPPLFLAQDFNNAVYTWHEGHTSWIKSKDFLTIEWICLIIIIIVVFLHYK